MDALQRARNQVLAAGQTPLAKECRLAAPADLDHTSPVPSAAKSVLVAEDDAFLRETIAAALREHGITVECATNGEEAIAAIDRKAPDLLLLDLLMPKKDGFAVLQHLKAKGYRFPVVILSNFQQEDCFSQSGAADFIVKSDLDVDQIWDTVKQHLP
jgi:CheY-like chemotaxis protein